MDDLGVGLEGQRRGCSLIDSHMRAVGPVDGPSSQRRRIAIHRTDAYTSARSPPIKPGPSPKSKQAAGRGDPKAPVSPCSHVHMRFVYRYSNKAHASRANRKSTPPCASIHFPRVRIAASKYPPNSSSRSQAMATMRVLGPKTNANDKRSQIDALYFNKKNYTVDQLRPRCPKSILLWIRRNSSA